MANLMPLTSIQQKIASAECVSSQNYSLSNMANLADSITVSHFF